MIKFLAELKSRNRVLFLFGLLCLTGAILSMIMAQRSTVWVLGINAWIKPVKFFVSVWIFCWTIGWYLFYLKYRRAVAIYSWMVVVVMAFELVVITWQAANGRRSHFNLTNALYASLFTAMGVAITVLTVWTGYMAYLFFRQKQFTIPSHFVWAIRIAIIFFVIFSFEGGVMAARLSHTVGEADGTPGLPFFNWSRLYGDLRVAHFFGIHSLQIIPLVAWYFTSKTPQVIIFAVLYFIFVLVFLLQALYQIPFME